MIADVHGDVWARGAAADHAVNVASGGPPAWLRDVLGEALQRGVLAAYPDERAAVAAVARRHGRHPDEVVMLNGAAQGFGLVARALAPRRPVIVHPQFTEPDRVLPNAAHVVLSDPYILDAPERIPAGADLVVVGNPTNPTGVLHPRAAIEAIIKPGRTVLVDEAFMDFIPGQAASLADQGHHEGLVVLRSLTKVLAVPGLRVGYALAPPPLARALRDARDAWSVNALALVAAQHAAAHPHLVAPIARRAQSDRAALEHALHPVAAAVHPGAANFVLIKTHNNDATHLARRLRADHGIAVRPAGAFPGLTPAHLRLTARGEPADARLVSALAHAAAPRQVGHR